MSNELCKKKTAKSYSYQFYSDIILVSAIPH